MQVMNPADGSLMFGDSVPAAGFWARLVPRSASALAGACGALVAVTALAVLVGWLVDIEAIRRVVPSLPDMKPVTAVGLLTLGVALWLLRRPDVQPPQRVLGRMLAVAVAGLGAWVIAEYAWGGTMLDLLLFPDAVGGEAVTYPGRPSPHTAVALIACGLALAFLDSGARRRYRPSMVLTPTAAIVVLASLVGYLYGVDYLYGASGVSGMSLHTCAAFLLLVAGIAASRPDREPMRTFTSRGVGGRLARQFAPLMLIVPAVVAGMRLLGQDAQAAPTSLAMATVALVAVGLGVCAYTARSLDRSEVTLVVAGQQVRDERDYSAAIVASLEDGLVVTSPAGAVLDVSDAFLELTDFAREDLVGATPPLPWWPPDQEPEVESFFTNADTRDARTSQDVFLQRKTGDLIPAIATRQAVFDLNGGVRALVVTFKDNTERFLAERAIREAEEQFRTVFDDAPSGMAILSLRHRFVRVNRAFAEMTGYEPDDLLGMTVAGLTHPDDREADAAAFAAMVSGETRSSRATKRYLRADGKIVWVELQATLIVTADGNPSHVVTQGRDITAEAAAIAAREQAEAELRASEQRFRTLSMQAPIGIVESDRAGQATWMNDRWCELTGLTPEQAAGDGWAAALHPHDRERVMAGWRRATATGSDFALEYRFQHPDETIVWVSARATPLSGSDGLPVGWLGTVDDISERREQEQALRESDERFRTALDANADGFYVLQARRDRAGEIVDFIVEELNEAGARLFGTPREESIGRGMIEQFGEILRDSGIWERYCMVCETRASTDEELELPSGSGDMAWFNVRMTPLGDGLVISSRDVTERRNAELALHVSEERFHAARDTNLDSFVLLEAVRDPDGAICDFRFGEINTVGAELAGRTREQIIGRLVSEVVPESPAAKRLFTSYSSVYETGEPIDAEFSHVAPGGREQWLHHQIARVGKGVAVSTRDITEAKLIKIALQQAVALFRTTFESAPIGMILLATDGAVKRANPAALEIFGSDEARFIGTHPLDAIESDDFEPTTSEAFARLLRGEDEDFALNARFRHDAGHTVWCHVTATLVRDPDGTPAYFLAQFKDITARRKAELALHASEERFHIARDTNLDSFALLEAVRDHDGAIRDFQFSEINAVGADLAGRTREQMIGCLVSEISPDSPVSRHLFESYLSVCETGKAIDAEFAYPASDGPEQWLHHQIARIGDGVAVSTRDITEAKHIKIALQQAEALFRTTFESAPVGMVLIATDGAVKRANPAALEIFGSDEALFIGSHPLDAIQSDDLEPATGEAFARLLRGDDEDFALNARFRHSAGHTVWCHVTATLVRHTDGAPAYFLAQFEDVTAGQVARERVQWLADHDPLTGALNRRRLEQEIDRHIALTDRYGARGALLMLDIDAFKYVNDTLGHQCGDQQIKRVATILHDRLRSTDVIARLGGDEFAVLLPEGGAHEASVVAEAICRAVAEDSAAGDPQQAVKITTSIGVAVFTGTGAATHEDMLVSADIAMYNAKESGGNGACVYEPGQDQQERMRARMGWGQRIRDALAGEGFELWLQPILDLGTDTVAQHEVLLRLRDPSGELILPGAFLYAAERFDLIQEIDRHVSRRAIRMAAEHQRAGNPIVLEVNLSGKSIGDPLLLAAIEHELAETGVDASSLVFEITETDAVANVQQAREFAEKLRELGCRFALDDFGASFGSFYYLKDLPFDYLKIDGEFIRSALTNPTDRLVIQAIVDIARGLGKRTIAEFVENDETLEFLRASGVDFAQGYLVGRPQPIPEALGTTELPRAA